MSAAFAVATQSGTILPAGTSPVNPDPASPGVTWYVDQFSNFVPGDGTYYDIVALNIDSVITVADNITTIDQAVTSENNAAASATAAANSATAASNSQSAAAGSATVASNSATTAQINATNAGTSATNAGTSETNANNYWHSFNSMWYGPYATPPTLDPFGQPITPGDVYFNTTSNTSQVWNGTAWQVVPGGMGQAAADARYLQLVGGTLTGALTLAANAASALQPVPLQQLNSTVAAYAPLASPALSGTPTAPTAMVGTNSTALATTAFVQTATSGAAAPAFNDVGRNKLHNPLFNVAQRGAGPWTTAGVYTVDRWITSAAHTTGSLSVSRQQQSDAARSNIGDEASVWAINNTYTGGTGAGDFDVFAQLIEGVRRLAGKTVTVSFWAVAAANVQLGISLDQVFGTGGTPSARVNGNGQAVPVTAAWTRFSRTFTLPSASGMTLGTNGDDYTALQIWYSAGTGLATRSGSIGVQNGNVTIWGVQLEIGSVATPLEKPDPQQDLAKCQRFYQVGWAQSSGYAVAAITVGGVCQLPVTMRAIPTFTVANQSYTNASAAQVGAFGGPGSYGFTASVTASGGYVASCSFTASADL